MKTLIAFLLLSAGSLLAAKEFPEIRDLQELRKCNGQRVILTGVYHDPGKGGRSVDCGFVSLDIEDYSFMTKTADGHLHDQLVEGQKIRFEAVIRYYEESKELVVRAKKPRGQIPQMRSTGSLKVIRGKEYMVYPESFSIREAKLLQPDASSKPVKE